MPLRGKQEDAPEAEGAPACRAARLRPQGRTRKAVKPLLEPRLRCRSARPGIAREVARKPAAEAPLTTSRPFLHLLGRRHRRCVTPHVRYSPTLRPIAACGHSVAWEMLRTETMNTRRRNTPAARYGFALLSVAILAWFELATWPLFRVTPFLPLAAGVVIAAILAGPGPGLFATALGTAATRLLPHPVQPASGPESVAPLIAFVGIGIAVSVLSMERHSGRSRIRRILGGVSDGCAFFGPDWKCVYVNGVAASQTGRSPEQLVGSGISDVFPHAAGPSILRGVRLAIDEGIPGRYETFDSHFERWFETNLYPAPEGVTIIVRDVTVRRQAEDALRQSERRLRAIFDQAIPGIAQTDREGRFLMVNERYCEIVGRAASDLLTLRMGDITHPEDLPRNAALFEGLMGDGGNFVVEERYVRPDGSLVWVRKQVSAVREADGTPLSGFSIVEEITERKQAEAEKDEALRRERGARAEAEAANRSKDEFLAVVSHELRTPLTAMLGWLRLMKLGAVEASGTSRALETVERNADALVRLVEDLLDVSRISAGKLELDVRPVELSAGGESQAHRAPVADRERLLHGPGRSRAPPAGGLEPPGERGQVHSGRRAGRCRPRAPERYGPCLDLRHRNRNRFRVPPQSVRSIPASRRHAVPETLRAGPGPFHRAPRGRDARGHCPGRKRRDGSRHHRHRHAPGSSRGGNAPRFSLRGRHRGGRARRSAPFPGRGARAPRGRRARLARAPVPGPLMERRRGAGRFLGRRGAGEPRGMEPRRAALGRRNAGRIGVCPDRGNPRRGEKQREAAPRRRAHGLRAGRTPRQGPGLRLRRAHPEAGRAGAVDPDGGGTPARTQGRASRPRRRGCVARIHVRNATGPDPPAAEAAARKSRRHREWQVRSALALRRDRGRGPFRQEPRAPGEPR